MRVRVKRGRMDPEVGFGGAHLVHPPCNKRPPTHQRVGGDAGGGLYSKGVGALVTHFVRITSLVLVRRAW